MIYRKVTFVLVILILSISISCKDENPVPEEKGKLVTDVDLIFSPSDGGAPLAFGASDPRWGRS